MTGQELFLFVYAGLVAMLALAALSTWRLSQPPRPVATQPELTDVELGALNGGPRLAVITAATELRRSCVMHTREGTLVANGPLANGAGELECELFVAVRRGSGTPAPLLLRNAAESATVDRLITNLERAGLRLEAGGRMKLDTARCCAIVLAVAGAAGLAAIASTSDPGPNALDLTAGHGLTPLGATAALTIATLVLAGWARRRSHGPSIAGRRLLKAVRRERASELRVAGGRPALAVAIFGSAALWQIDPAYAAALDVPSHIPTSVGLNSDAFAAGWETGCGGGCGGCGG